ncbi:MAG: hypothetical protein ACOYY2_12905 [Actinomycetota bacterium]
MPIAPPPNPKQQAGLDEVRLITRMMREHQQQIVELGKRRRKKILKLRGEGVTYRKIAEAMETTEQAVYKVVRGDL